MNYPMYPQNYPQYPAYQPYQQPVNSFQNGTGSPQSAAQMAPPVNTSLVPVRSFAEIDQWPIAPNSCVTFVIEGNPPTVCTKSRGLSQLESPVLEVFDLVKREAPQPPAESPQAAPDAPPEPAPAYALQSDVDALGGAVELLRNELEDFRARLDDFATKKPGTGKKEDSDNG